MVANAASTEEVVKRVNARVDKTLRDNRRHELIVVGVLVALAAVGLGLIVLGAIMGRWEMIVPGGFVQVTIIFPIRQLIRLREDNIRLQIIPQLLALSDTAEGRLLAAKFVERLIKRV